jgi:hypothetical protein
MSWQPPPSFGDSGASTIASPTSKSRKISAAPAQKSPIRSSKKKATWAPTFFVVSDTAVDTTSSPRGKGNAATTSPVRSSDKPSSTAGGVNWNQTLFVVDNDDGHQEEPTTAPSTNMEDAAEAEKGEIMVPRFRRSFSRKDTLIVDEAMLATRLEWNQLLVSKAFKPYRQMMCEIDDDLPGREDLDALEEDDDYMEDNQEMNKIRDEMLDDPDLNEREIASFFEGFKLFQIKINSLTAQLEGMRAMQRLTTQSVMMSTRQLHNPTGAASERYIGRSMPPTVPATRGSMPPAAKDRKIMMGMSKTSVSGDPRDSPKPLENPPVIVAKVYLPLAPVTEDKPAAENVGATKVETPPEKPKDQVPPLPAKKTEGGKPPKAAPRREFRKDAKPRSSDAVVPKASKSLRALSIQRIRESLETSLCGNNEDIKKLLEELEEAEKRQKKLEKQLAQAGVVIAEDIPYDVAKQQVERIAIRMGQIGGSDVADANLREEYFKLEQDMEKYSAALQVTDEWAAEQEEMERQWEASVTPDNEEAIKKLRRHMPVEVRNMSEAALCTQPTPNGKFLPKNVAKKFKRTNVLQALRINPEDMIPMHPSTLENMRVTGLTLTERRALYQHLKSIGPRWKAQQADKMTERKWTWFNMMKSNFKENVDSWQRHVDQYGPPGNHPYATRDNPKAGCPLIGKQCPLKADKLIDYDEDYGFPEDDKYFSSEVKKSEVDNVSQAQQEIMEAAREKKASERGHALKLHYKGKLLQVSLSNGSCEAMDESMDKMEGSQEKWIKNRLSSDETPTEDSKKKEVASFNESLNEMKLSILQFAERSGMQLTGKRDANADQADIRSMIELALCEEVIETALDFFKGIEERMDELKAKDGRMKSTIQQLRTLLEELHERNLHIMEVLGQERPGRSRRLKTREAISSQAKKELARKKEAEKEAAPEAPVRPPGGMPGRGGLMNALQGGRGRGSGDAGGRGGLMSALAGRGRGRGGGGGGGDLMAAIAGRGRGRGGVGGDLMAAIAGRGRGRGGGGLMAAIAARGAGGN